jgi:hypothetical protein
MPNLLFKDRCHSNILLTANSLIMDDIAGVVHEVRPREEDSGYEGRSELSTASMTSSVFDYEQEDGCSYHTFHLYIPV